MQGIKTLHPLSMPCSIPLESEGTPIPGYAPSVIARYRVPANDNGLMQKLAMMKQLTNRGKQDPNIHNLVGNILFSAGVRNKDQQGEVRCIVDWFVGNVAYRRDIQGVETFQDPWYTITSHRGDCDDAAITLSAMLESLGYRTQYKAIETHNSGGGYNHVYLTVELPRGSGRWVPIDATMPEKGLNGFGWEAPKVMVRKTLNYPVGAAPQRTVTMMPGIERHFDWTGANLAQEVDGLGAWYNNWDDFTHAISVNVGSVIGYGTSAGQTLTQGYQAVARETQQVYSNMSQYITNGVYDLTKLQLPPALRNSPFGQYITSKSAEIANGLKNLLPDSPLKKAVAWMVVGNLAGAIMVVKAHQDEVIRDLPPYARNVINKMRVNLPQYLGGTRSSLSGLGSSFTWWDNLSNGKKTAIIAIIVVAVVLYVLCAIYAGCSLSVAITKLAEMSVIALTGAVGAVSSLIAAIISTVKSWFISDPNTPTATAANANNPPTAQYQPTQEDLNAIAAAGKTNSGMGIAGAVLVGLLVLV